MNIIKKFMELMNSPKVITTTETYDPCFVTNYESKLKDANICITKCLNDNLIDILLRNKDRMILHLTVTGLGGTKYEPNVHASDWNFHQLSKLLQGGFPIEQFVLRMDPIIPYPISNIREYYVKVLQQCLFVTEKFRLSNYKIRCIVSMLDMYPHVRDRFRVAGIPTDPEWNKFHAPKSYFEYVEYNLLEPFKDHFEFQSCAETGFSSLVAKRGCISELDLKILDQDINDYVPNKNGTRGNCLCLVKKNCLGIKPKQCPHGCKYCYWKD